MNLLGTSCQSVQVSGKEHSCGLAWGTQLGSSEMSPLRKVPSRAAVALSDERAMSTRGGLTKLAW